MRPALLRGSVERYIPPIMLHQRLRYSLIAILTGCTSASTKPEQTKQETAPQTFFLRVVRLQNPTDTSITIDAAGTLQRIEERQLVVSTSGTRAISADTASAFLTRAAALPSPTAPTMPYEGDVYTVVDGNLRTISAPAAIASSELSALVQAVLTEADQVALAGNADFYVSAEPVQQDRLERLQSRGRTAVNPQSLDQALAAIVQSAVGAPYQLRRVDEAQFHALETALAGRDSFVAADATTWHQLNLWSPPL